MREHGGDTHCVLKLKLCLRSDSVEKSSSLRYSHRLARIAFFLDVYLWCPVA